MKQSGSHWVSVFISLDDDPDKDFVIYFNSSGKKMRKTIENEKGQTFINHLGLFLMFISARKSLKDKFTPEFCANFLTQHTQEK